ncbi:hypothetical protein AN216_09630 [Streptomyces oceani]|uniref:Lantibiotic dehydratase n=1 Tax=Streptomyces oceani TaxID=1075402 RepID=A0A1E7KJ10_9ACTN|nr:hypothetical protein AN216_09630 [Streptomyces oceani]
MAALAAGDYRLLVSNGSYTAGAMAGRFAHVLGTERELAALYEAEAPDGQHRGGPDGGEEAPLPVQLFFQPRSPRSNNVARTPRLLPHAAPVGCFSPGGGGGRGEGGDRTAGREIGADIGLDELAVGATADRLFLVHAPTGREVDIRRPNMLNIATEAPNLARFLAGLGMSGLRPWAPWQWSRLDVLPYLPRVRRGRTILSPARWRPTPALRDAGLDERDWLRELDRWRESCAVPDRLRVSVLDQHLDLDLTAPVHRHVLRGQLTGRGVPLVQESPLADPAQLGWSGGHATEVVVPLLPARPRPAVPRVRAGSRPTGPEGPSGSGTPLHAPGGEWLYAKLYAARDRLEPLLVRELAPLLARVDSAGDVDRWFFLRYADPGAHLRLRLHGEPAALRERVLPVLHDWVETATSQGTLRKLVLDTYEPEAERYGGPDALTAAERLFHADSRLVTAQLTARTRGQLSAPVETLAATNHALLLGALGDWDWWHWVLATYPMELQNRIPARQRRAAAHVVEPALRAPADPSERPDSEEPLSEEPPEVVTARAELTRAARAYGRALRLGSGDPSTARGSAVASVLHMHANRLLGTDRAAEQRSYGLLRAAVRTQVGRTEHARGRRG